MQKVSAEPYYSTSFPPTKFTFPRHGSDAVLGARGWLWTPGGRVSLRVWSLQKVSTDPYFYSTRVLVPPPLISLSAAGAVLGMREDGSNESDIQKGEGSGRVEGGLQRTPPKRSGTSCTRSTRVHTVPLCLPGNQAH